MSRVADWVGEQGAAPLKTARGARAQAGCTGNVAERMGLAAPGLDPGPPGSRLVNIQRGRP